MKSEDLMKAADDARRILRGFRAFEEVATALEASATAVRLAEEAESRMNVLRAELEVVKADHGAAVAQLEKARKDGKAALEADQVKAKARAEKTMADAVARAVELVEAAEKRAAGIDAEADKVRVAAGLIAAEVEAKRAELAELNAGIETARATIARMAGA